MNLTSPSQVKSWCIENGFHPNKVLGQNFLIDRNALEAIVDAGIGDEPSPHVLEVGPGLGVLTEEMLARGANVVAVEKDPVLADRLAASLGNPEALEVVCADALDFIAGGRSAGFGFMVSNLPYQAGTRILLELVMRREIPSITALVQTEVADRLAAGEGSKTRSLSGVWTQLDYDVKIVRRVAASCFWPRPAIGSTVVKLTRHDRNVAFSPEQRDIFHRLTKKAFEHRRKQLGSVFKDMIQSTARAEELSNEDWLNLVKGLTNADA
ncbi:MAG: 16S rRNA (adenine(1518)-N(6)/adenine(1519)-N(6))-dimethyltransferase RsmA [Kiritimatiellae bacterium]|nr:16S rRNA (adenine(1518)-N(6)/adenine(1519)-N(6))-dimethyltransferase RsmA [Kiritimatiellia bacterium]